MGILAAAAIKKYEFQKSKMADAAILKNVKSPYRCNRLTDFLIKFGVVMHIGFLEREYMWA